MICPNCRTKNDHGAVYCKKCGIKLPITEEDYKDEDEYYEEVDDDDGSLLTKILVGSGIAIFLMVFAVFLFLVVSNRHKDAEVAKNVPVETTVESNNLSDQVSEEDTQEDTSVNNSTTEVVAENPTQSSEDPVEVDDLGDEAVYYAVETPIMIANKYKDLANREPVEFEGHAYALFDYKKAGLEKDFDACVEFCKRMGGHMAVINSKKENDFIYNYVQTDGVAYTFFGYTDEAHEGKWKWVDGSPKGYENWWKEGEGDENQPNNRHGKEHYAQFYGDMMDGSWCDAEFGEGSHKFVCEWE